MNEEKRPPKDKKLLSSLNHALIVMDLLCVRSNLGVSEISRITGFDKASVYKMLYTMQHRGYVIKTDNARYMPSGKLSSSNKTQARQNVVDVAAPHMRKLRDECGQTVLLGVLNTNGRIIFLHKEEGADEDSIRVRTAYEMDAYTSAGGKILLANLDAPMQRSILDMIDIYPHTPHTVESRESLQAQLNELRNKASIDGHDENYYGHADIAVPLWDKTGRCAASLSIVCPTSVLDTRREELRACILTAGRAISLEMGWQG